MILLDRVTKTYGGGVDAIALPCWCGTIGKHVAQMGTALAAQHLNAVHAVAKVFTQGDCLRGNRFVVARPTTARIELGGTGKQGLVAADAVVHTRRRSRDC